MIRTIDFTSPYLPNFMAGMIATIAGYFAPVKGMAVVMLTAITIDLVFGIWASRSQGAAIESRRMWRTGYKALIALIVVHLLHSIDQEMGIAGIQTSKIGSLFITGFEVWSILESAAIISDHPVFRAIKKYMSTKVKENTGIDLNEKT